MNSAVAVEVRDTAEAAAVLATAGALVPLLLSPPGAAAWLGPHGWAALIAEAAARVPGVAHRHALDCAAAPGHALAGLRAGLPCLVLDGRHPGFPAVAAAAAEAGAALLPERPKALNLAGLDLGRPAALARLRALIAAWPRSGA
ncbi:hypothetical protein ACQW02_15520 [Humitalea sp. 24SJ18S-53]|uniref:hypothetical protein n=1 Tax=Humitalea sp. 24SJ18S-53 TaxID=3422307 RepID=UPI003D666E5F